MKRIVVFALVLNAALLGVIAHQLVAIAGGGVVATQNGDTNGDGTRDISDAVHLLQWLFSGGEPPVAIAQEGGGLSPEQAEMLEHMSIVYLPVDDDGNTAKTIRFSGVNVQVVNGSGSTATWQGNAWRNGLGNLIVGYQEMRSDDGDPDTDDSNVRIGSHNLVVGNQNNYHEWGSQVVGSRNTVLGHLSTVSGGQNNTVLSSCSTVSGGRGNTASGGCSVVGGGSNNAATGGLSTVPGGEGNTASGGFSTVSGGGGNTASGDTSTVSGGSSHTASGIYSTVGGGENNTAAGSRSTVSGGRGNRATGQYSTVIGGHDNRVLSLGSMAGGGFNIQDDEDDPSIYSAGFGDGRE